MVIGNGLVATTFAPYINNENVLIFASGVSNSKCVDDAAFEREFVLVQQSVQQHPQKIFVYFSTCSINDGEEQNSPYILHKLKIENYLYQNVKAYYVFRISNLVGKTNNPFTIVNYLYKNVNNQIVFDLWKNAYRNLIDVTDAYKIINEIVAQKLFLNEIVNVANPYNYSVQQIVASIEEHTTKKAIYKSIDKGQAYTINTDKIKPLFQKLNLSFSSNYLSLLLQKYYSINDV
jgi:nucleoside-diphosphate-sugar epimerase